MAGHRLPHTPPSDPDGDGVRVLRKPHEVRRTARAWVAAAVVLVTAAPLWFVLAPGSGSGLQAIAAPAAMDREGAGGSAKHPSPAARASSLSSTNEPPPRSGPDDLAAYFQPGDPEPTGGEVIEALQHAGVRTGIGAFNPPGTSPPLSGLAVPAGFELPEGYVRHHQVTDEGVPIEPILMFSPDFRLYDAQGRVVALPPDRVVPPALAPPGLPLRWVRPRAR